MREIGVAESAGLHRLELANFADSPVSGPATVHELASADAPAFAAFNATGSDALTGAALIQPADGRWDTAFTSELEGAAINAAGRAANLAVGYQIKRPWLTCTR